MLHIITIAKREGKKFAYHYMTEDRHCFIEKSRIIAKASEDLLSKFGVHVISDPSRSFAELQAMDPYFADVEQFESFSAFLAELRDKKDLINFW